MRKERAIMKYQITATIKTPNREEQKKQTGSNVDLAILMREIEDRMKAKVKEEHSVTVTIEMKEKSEIEWENIQSN